MHAGIRETVIPMSLLEQPPKSVRIEGRRMATTAHGSDRLLKTGRLENARGLVRPLRRPAHRSQRKGKLAIVAIRPALVA